MYNVSAINTAYNKVEQPRARVQIVLDIFMHFESAFSGVSTRM